MLSAQRRHQRTTSNSTTSTPEAERNPPEAEGSPEVKRTPLRDIKNTCDEVSTWLENLEEMEIVGSEGGVGGLFFVNKCIFGCEGQINCFDVKNKQTCNSIEILGDDKKSGEHLGKKTNLIHKRGSSLGRNFVKREREKHLYLITSISCAVKRLQNCCTKALFVCVCVYVCTVCHFVHNDSIHFILVKSQLKQGKAIKRLNIPSITVYLTCCAILGSKVRDEPSCSTMHTLGCPGLK